MADQPRRPAFKDGQPLAAADLDLIVEGARDRAARHERGAHTPGIVAGLGLREDTPGQGLNAGTDITVSAGVAVDAAGRQIVLPSDQKLPPTQFLTDGGSVQEDPDLRGTTYPHPVFLSLDERDVSSSAFGACGEPGGGDRIVEDWNIRIGHRGDHLNLGSVNPPGPGDELATVVKPYPVLLGFVRRHLTTGRWAAVVDELDGVRARRAGVRAGEVVTPGDLLTLRAGDPLAAGQPALVVDTGDDGRLLFGKTRATGGVDPVFTVKHNGDVEIAGRLTPALEAGAIWTYSAIVTDGTPLPLPAGVDEAKVKAGGIIVHTTITPRYPVTPDYAFLVGRCDIDASRIAHCTLVRLRNSGPAYVEPVPVAAANVTVTAVLMPEKSGDKP